MGYKTGYHTRNSDVCGSKMSVADEYCHILDAMMRRTNDEIMAVGRLDLTKTISTNNSKWV